MPYPESLLPKAHYRLLDFDKTQSQSYFLVRHTDSTDLTDADNRLKAEYVAFPSDRLCDYSTNLLGEFRPEDVGWRFAKESAYLTPWTPGDGNVQIPIIDADVSWVENRGCFFLLIADYHEIQFEVETPTGSQTVVCKALHTPIRGNFWHCSLRWFVNDEDVAEWSKNRRERILKVARSFIIQNVHLSEPAYQAVSPTAYQ